MFAGKNLISPGNRRRRDFRRVVPYGHTGQRWGMGEGADRPWALPQARGATQAAGLPPGRLGEARRPHFPRSDSPGRKACVCPDAHPPGGAASSPSGEEQEEWEEVQDTTRVRMSSASAFS